MQIRKVGILYMDDFIVLFCCLSQGLNNLLDFSILGLEFQQALSVAQSGSRVLLLHVVTHQIRVGIEQTALVGVVNSLVSLDEKKP